MRLTPKCRKNRRFSLRFPPVPLYSVLHCTTQIAHRGPYDEKKKFNKYVFTITWPKPDPSEERIGGCTMMRVSFFFILSFFCPVIDFISRPEILRRQTFCPFGVQEDKFRFSLKREITGGIEPNNGFR